MTLLPVLPWPVLLVVVVALLAAVWWNPSSASVPGESRARHWRLTAAVALLGLAALRPALPGGDAETSAANLNVYFVVDTTTSIVAEDWGDERPRVEGVASDVAAIAERLPGARFSVVTFDQATRVRLPLTTDTTALDAALETLLPEPSEYSHGSSVTAARERLATLLEQARTRSPERGRVVYYLGDGEQTAPEPPEPFALDTGLVNGGAVLGYGTSEGGRMKSTRALFDGGASYVKDPTDGEDARSVISEPTLRSIADQLGVAYVHRDAASSVDAAVDGGVVERYGSSPRIERQHLLTRDELYWVPLTGLAALALAELVAGVTTLVQARARKGTGS